MRLFLNLTMACGALAGAHTASAQGPAAPITDPSTADGPPVLALAPPPALSPARPVAPLQSAPPPPRAEAAPAPALAPPTDHAPVLVPAPETSGVGKKVGTVAGGVVGGVAGAAVAGPIGKFAGGFLGKRLVKGILGGKPDIPQVQEATVVQPAAASDDGPGPRTEVASRAGERPAPGPSR